MPKEGKKQGELKSGGLAFFSSLIFLTITASLSLSALPEVVLRAPIERTVGFGASVLFGAALARVGIRNHTAVFLHELKHSIVSNFAGNRARGMKIRRNRGHFEYEYTPRTKACNAFISLAPYYVPVLTIGVAICAAALLWKAPLALTVVVAVAVGADAELAIRDIGPHQTDFSNLRGGFTVGLFYVIVMNLTVLCFLMSGLLLHQEGLMIVGERLWSWVYTFVDYLRTRS